MAFEKVFFPKFGGNSVHWRHKRTIHKRFLCKNCVFRQFVNVFSLESFALYGMTLNVPLSIFLSWRAECSNRIIESSCVNSLMASIYALKCTQQFECYKCTLHIVMHYATRFRSNSKISSTIIKVQYTQL